MLQKLDSAPTRLHSPSSNHRWSDPSTLAVFQLMVESVTEMIGFEVAILSVLFDDDLVTVAYSGPEEFCEQALRTDPAWVLDPVLDQAETWGRFHFLAAEDIVGEFAGTWIETSPEQAEGPDAWHPKDVLIGVLTNDLGALCGILSVDRPVSRRRPDAPQRRLLERYAAQAERAVIAAFEREDLVQQIAHAEGARRLIRSASMPAQASLEAVLNHTHRPLVEGFAARGSWIQVLGPDATRRGYAQLRDGAVVALPESVVDVACRLAPQLWEEQVVLALGHGVDYPVPGGAVDPALIEGIRREMYALGLKSLLAVPLGVGAECLGVLALTRAPRDPIWSPIETASALEIGHDLGAALMTARALERERDLVSELQQLDDYRINLIETLSHEMRTPLAVISGNLEMLGDVVLDDSAAHFRDAMNRGATRMKRVVDDLLLLAAISHPQRPVLRDPVDVNQVVRDVVDLVSSTATAKQVTLLVTPPVPDLVVTGDADEVDRLLSNLVSNAVKYTRAGGTVAVSALRRGESVVIEVVDDGIGISPADQAGLFTAFFRTTNPDALREPGTGLGLAIVAHVAQRHGGTAEVRSRLNEGTTFVVTLPAG